MLFNVKIFPQNPAVPIYILSTRFCLFFDEKYNMHLFTELKERYYIIYIL